MNGWFVVGFYIKKLPCYFRWFIRCHTHRGCVDRNQDKTNERKQQMDSHPTYTISDYNTYSSPNMSGYNPSQNNIYAGV